MRRKIRHTRVTYKTVSHRRLEGEANKTKHVSPSLLSCASRCSVVPLAYTPELGWARPNFVLCGAGGLIMN